MRALIPSLILTAGIFLTLMVQSFLPKEGRPVWVLFNPAMGEQQQMQAIVLADALLIDAGAVPGSFLLKGAESGGIGRLMAQGALLVLNPVAAAGCGGDVAAAKRLALKIQSITE
ncbi:hypothetical protein [Kordiimonas sp.]|uniref:hypothetical protein n=2 Tax=Kordiimonas sp. TaxID=1970157 RepID=UPI003A92D619